MKVLDSNAKHSQIQSRLNKHTYLSKNILPGFADAKVFKTLQTIKRYPDRKSNPNFYHWYILIKQFALNTIEKWITQELYYDPEDSLVSQFVKMYENKMKKQSITESSQNIGSQNKVTKPQNTETQWLIDMTLKSYSTQTMSGLRKLIQQYKAEMTEEQKNSQINVRIICRTQKANFQQFKKKIQSCIQYYNFSWKRNDMKGQKTMNPIVQKSE